MGRVLRYNKQPKRKAKDEPLIGTGMAALIDGKENHINQVLSVVLDEGPHVRFGAL